VVCAVSGQGGPLHLSLAVTITASASFFGTHCTLSPTVPLTGEISGPLGDFTAVLRAAFSVPGATPNPTCSPALTSAVNGLLGFPSPPGSAVLNLVAHGEAYCLVKQQQHMPLCILR